MQNMTMIMVNIFEAKAKLSDLLDRAAAGERILICKRNQPVAELRPIAAPRQAPRPVGGAKKMVTVPPAFFDPLPEEVLDAFGGGAVFPAMSSGDSRVAEAGPRPSRAVRPRRGTKRR
jgi:prevent-host-death family protein